MAVKKRKTIWLILMIILYVGAGINHFIHPEFYLEVIPRWFPYHTESVWLSGIVEIALGVLLIFPRTQHAAAWAISVMLIVFMIFIHIPMVLDFKGWDNFTWWVAVVRLPVQYFLFRWSYRYTKGRVVAFWKSPYAEEH